MAHEKVRASELENERLRASKRRKKVREDPNSRFVTIEQVIAAREGMGPVTRAQEVEDPEEGMDEDEDPIPEPEIRRSGRIRVPTKRAIEIDVDY